MNYFEFYNLQPAFNLDEGALRKTFKQKSRELHPDHHSDAHNDTLKVVQMSALNNDAYKVLSDFESRIKYILEIFGLLGDPTKSTMDMSFLSEMLEVNEQIMEYEAQGESIPQEMIDSIKSLDTSLKASLLNEGQAWDKSIDAEERVSLLENIKENYLKRRYILRILEKFDTFATQ